ncbi:MAG: serine hydrolase [Vicinamibacterales bacterium]
MAGEVTRRGYTSTACLVVLAMTGDGLSATQRAAAAPADLSGFEAAIRDELAKVGAPGAAVAVVIGDAVVWAKGFGVASVETNAAVTPDTLFQIGSVTKAFTAAAVLAASTQGVVAPDRPVRSYVSGLTPCVGAPTLAQLLSHTGGIIDEPDEFGPQGEDGLGAYQRTWTSEYCLLPPGRAFSYSNSGYALAGLALQDAEKKPFAEVMRARVLDPLGMTRTTFRPTEAMTWPLAVGHRSDKEGKFTVVRPLANDARLWPAGTLYSSASELARFLVAMMNDGRVNGRQALPAGVATQMRASAARVATTGQHYGQGLFLYPAVTSGPLLSAFHGGTMTGYAAQLALFAEGSGVVVLTNGDGVNPGRIAEIARQAGQTLATGKPASFAAEGSQPAPSPGVFLPSDQALRYVGTYSNPRRFTLEVVRDGDGLTLKRFGRDFPMRYLAPGQFQVGLPRGGYETIVFGLPDAGPADYLQMNVWALARVEK